METYILTGTLENLFCIVLHSVQEIFRGIPLKKMRYNVFQKSRFKIHNYHFDFQHTFAVFQYAFL